MGTSFIVFAGVAPHPPIMVSEVGGDAVAEVHASVLAMREFTGRIIKSGAKTVVLISPHAPIEPRAFVAYLGDKLHGSLANFRAPEVVIEATLDDGLLSEITRTASDRGFRIVGLEDCELDHGTSVPLYFLQRYGWHGKVVCLGYTFLSNDDHLSFGNCIRSAVDSRGQPVAVVASGDLSHRLKPGSPAGYNDDAHLFDAQIVAAINQCAPDRIIGIDHGLRQTAGECGYRSMLVALGATDGLKRNYELLSYEAPFGVGYMVAQLTYDIPTEGKNCAEESHRDLASSYSQNPAALARETVETFVREKRQITPGAAGLGHRAACFVSIKTLAGELRGCVGTVEPARESLEEELITNAINAATRDMRFPPVTPEELRNLRYSVDVLSELEPANLTELDANIFGVVVEDLERNKRGVLLPAIAGVETVEAQVAIATRKAGIDPGSAIRLFRFRVSRFRESDHP